MSVRIVTEFRTLPICNPRQDKANAAMTDTSPTTVNPTLPRRLPNSAYRVREYMTEKEVDRLIEAARKRGRNGTRDAAAILLAYRHGLRAQELCSLRWSQIDLRNGGRTSIGLRAASRVCIRCMGLSCGPYAHYNRGRLMCS
jgi:integrase